MKLKIEEKNGKKFLLIPYDSFSINDVTYYDDHHYYLEEKGIKYVFKRSDLRQCNLDWINNIITVELIKTKENKK